MPKKCSSGQTLKKGYKRSSYVRKSGSKVHATNVPATCIKKRGQSKKSTVKIPGMQNYSGLLRSFGYELDLPAEQRKKALIKALKTVDPLFILRRLVSLRTFRKFEREKEPKEANNYESLDHDVKWLEQYYKFKNIKEQRQKILSKKGKKATSFIGIDRLKKASKKASKNKSKSFGRLPSWAKG